MIFLDTSALVGSLAGQKRSSPAFRRALDSGERLLITSLVMYEWLRGPRLVEELAMVEALFPTEAVVHFGTQEAVLSAKLYRVVNRPRSRVVDLAIAACAITHEAELWTLNRADFSDIPGLRLSSIR